MRQQLRHVIFLGVMAFLMLSGQPLDARSRVALVIGNAEYAHVARLPNAYNDSQDMAEKLGMLGFEVTLAQDLPLAAFTTALQRFARSAASAEEALIFFAGHGMEVEGENWLIPVDARLEVDIDVEFEAVALSVLLSAVTRARGLKLVILDACRDNPFIVGMDRRDRTRSVGRGLARVDPSDGTLVAFAARAGQVAADGDGRNSPYTGALLDALDTPGLELGLMFRQVRDRVMDVTGRRQEPFTYGSLSAQSIYLNHAQEEAAPQGPAAPVSPPVTAQVPLPAPPDVCDSYFTQAREIGACYGYEAFVEDCAAHPFRNIAQRFIDNECGDDTRTAMAAEALSQRSAPAPAAATPTPADQGHIPAGWCAITIASRPSLLEAANFIALLPRDGLDGMMVYQSVNGWYAISPRRVAQRDADHALAQGKAAGHYPDDAYCATGTRFGPPQNWRSQGPTIRVHVAHDTTGYGYMNLRAGPGTNHPSLARMDNGTRVAVLEEAGQWARVRRADGQTGWMHMAPRFGYPATD